MASHLVDRYYSKGLGVMRRMRKDDSSTPPPPPPPPPTPGPWFGNVEEGRDRLGTNPQNSFAWWQQINSILRNQMPSPPTNVSTFMHGYSGSSLPTSFNSSSVASADNQGIGAMLNVKRPWAGLAAGNYDADIASLFNSWPVGTFGSVTMNHEPEDDSGVPDPQTPANPAWKSWAQANGPVWKDGVNQFINVAAPIIRARGLDVKVGGCLMDFSWDPGTPQRFTYFNWWDELDPANLDVAAFQIDVYFHANSNGTMRDFHPRMNQLIAEARSVGIQYMDLFETNFSRAAAYGSGQSIVATAATQAQAWRDYANFLNTIPEMRMVCEFHLDTGFASQNAWLAGADPGGANNLGGALDAYTDIAVAGRRDGVTGG